MTKLYVYPETLREKADSFKGFPHVSFEMVQRASENVKVHLYVPQGFSVPDSASYGTIDIGMIGNADKDTAVSDEQADDLALLQAGKFADLAGLGALTPITQKAALEQGIALNPNTRVQFETVQLRSFSFEFKMVSQSSEEAKQIFLIENLFRKALYPTKQGDFVLIYPPTFKIQFLHGDQPSSFMPIIKECFLTNLSTTYNAGSNMYHADGAPSEVDISMTFQETELVTREQLYGPEQGIGNPGSEFGLDSIEGEIQNRVNALETQLRGRVNEAKANFNNSISNITSRFKL